MPREARLFTERGYIGSAIASAPIIGFTDLRKYGRRGAQDLRSDGLTELRIDGSSSRAVESRKYGTTEMRNDP